MVGLDGGDLGEGALDLAPLLLEEDRGVLEAGEQLGPLPLEALRPLLRLDDPPGALGQLVGQVLSLICGGAKPLEPDRPIYRGQKLHSVVVFWRFLHRKKFSVGTEGCDFS